MNLYRVRRTFLRTVRHAGLSLIALTSLLPFLWMLSTSF